MGKRTTVGKTTTIQTTQRTTETTSSVVSNVVTTTVATATASGRPTTLSANSIGRERYGNLKKNKNISRQLSVLRDVTNNAIMKKKLLIDNPIL